MVRSRSIFGIAVLVLATLVMIFGTPTNVSASGYQCSPPWWDHHTFYYHWYENSTFLNDEIEEVMDDGGYNAWVEEDVSAEFARLVMPYDAVWSFCGHANRTTCTYWDGSSYSYLTASNIRSHSIIPDLADLRLAVFTGCKTAQDPWKTSSKGLLYSAVVVRQVDCAVGFEGTIQFAYMVPWDLYFFEELVYNERPVYYAAIVATARVMDEHASDGGTRTHYEMGNTTLKIIPAGYGTP